VFSEPAGGRKYFNTNASHLLKIIGVLEWNVSFYGNWDSGPPVAFSVRQVIADCSLIVRCLGEDSIHFLRIGNVGPLTISNVAKLSAGRFFGVVGQLR